MRVTHKDLGVCKLTPEQHLRTCGYWYVVHAASLSHTAFVTRAGLDRWLAERRLTLESPLEEEGAYSRIVGEYRTDMHMEEADYLDSLTGERTRTLSNGDYVEAVISLDADGLRTVHTLNPNVRNRKTFDYRESYRLMS